MKDQKSGIEGKEKKRTFIGGAIVAAFGLVSGIYLLNPTAGVFELIPDNIPVIGNLDEAAAVAILISCLAYFGVDIGGFFGRKPKKRDVFDAEIIDSDE